MKLTGEMVHEAFEKALGHPIEDRSIYSDVATILYAQLNQDELIFTLDYAEDADSLIAADFEDLLRLIKKHGVEGDYITIYVQDEDNEDIGEGQFYYKQGSKFLEAIETYGAAIDLEKTLNELEAKQAQASA